MLFNEVQDANDPLSPSTHTESMPESIARRILTQGLPLSVVGSRDVQPHLRPLTGKVPELASGIQVDRGSAQEALRAGQAQLADDVQALFPGDGHMAHVGAQLRAKSQPEQGDGQAHAQRPARER